MTNEELVQKAIITTDSLASAGKLNPAQADKFIDYVVDESVLKNNARIVRFREDSMDIDKIGIGQRMAFPKTEAQDPGLRRGVSLSKISLQPKTLILPFEISDEFKEINIEGENVEDTIIRMMARQLANDMEELYIHGDTLGHAILESDYKDGGSTTKYVKDKYLAMFNGWGRLADSGHQFDADSANVGLSVFGSMLRQLPTKFRRNRSALRFFLSPDLAQLYIEKLATRATSLGDSAAGGAAHAPYGVPLVEVPLLQFLPQVVQHIVLSGTTASALRYNPVSSVVVSKSTLLDTAESAYSSSTDYLLDATAGTVARRGGSTIGDGDTVKVTYAANPQIILTHFQNFIIGIGRDIRIEKDRDIYKGVNQYAITAKIAVQLEETDAVVKGSNVGQGV
jgi:hypothetical protein